MTFPPEKNRFLSQAFMNCPDGLSGYAMVLSRDRTEAEDLVQETCVRAMQAMESVRPCSNVKSWLFTILRNIWLNRFATAPGRSQDGRTRWGREHRANRCRNNPKILTLFTVSKVERQLVREAILQLSDEFREIVVLREFEDLSYKRSLRF